MRSTITISAVGDIMMWREQVEAARSGDSNTYQFDQVFHGVAPIFQESDLVIGNLETTLSGPKVAPQLRNALNGFPRFSCPDQLVPALKKAGFDVLTTANNHCMDHGVKGVRRTLDVLDKHGIKHTGTARSRAEANRQLIVPVKGIRVGILAYTYGTNGIHPPANQRWAVNIMRRRSMLADIRRMRRSADLVIAAVHFGREFRRSPELRHVSLVRRLWREGVDIVLGSHPHVVQPTVVRRVRSVDGQVRRCVAVYSLGNFVSRRMWRNPYTERGLILQVRVGRDRDGRAQVHSVKLIPTLTRQRAEDGRPLYAVVRGAQPQD
jgi:poly-gamma-glutamate capsule biosynthesis protein CapA/YwtB (metallophosphatase superfamily)